MALPAVWPSIKDGRRRRSQEWRRRNGNAPDGYDDDVRNKGKCYVCGKGFKGKGHNNGFETNGNMQDEGDEPDFQYMEAREHAKGNGQAQGWRAHRDD